MNLNVFIWTEVCHWLSVLTSNDWLIADPDNNRQQGSIPIKLTGGDAGGARLSWGITHNDGVSSLLVTGLSFGRTIAHCVLTCCYLKNIIKTVQIALILLKMPNRNVDIIQ